MVANVAVKKEALPPHGWASASGKERGRVVRMGGAGSARPREERTDYGSLSIREREEMGRQIVEKAAAAKVKPLSQKDIGMWAANLLEANARRDNHSC